jgi:hypothetical protein
MIRSCTMCLRSISVRHRTVLSSRVAMQTKSFGGHWVTHTDPTSGSLSTVLNLPFGVTWDPMGNIYVSDTFNHFIQLFLVVQLSGIFIAESNGVREHDSDLLYAPYALQLDSQLNLYVADRSNHRVQVLHCKLIFVIKWWYSTDRLIARFYCHLLHHRCLF